MIGSHGYHGAMLQFSTEWAPPWRKEVELGKMSRTKGKRGELELMHKLNSYGFQTRRGDCFRHEPDVIGLLSIHIECKATAKIDISAWLSQSIRASEKYKDGLPVVMFRQVDKTHRGLPWLVSMMADDFEKMDGRKFFATERTIGIYERVKIAKDSGYDVTIDRFVVGPVITMLLDDWVKLYKNWKLPFTEERDNSHGEV